MGGDDTEEGAEMVVDGSTIKVEGNGGDDTDGEAEVVEHGIRLGLDLFWHNKAGTKLFFPK